MKASPQGYTVIELLVTVGVMTVLGLITAQIIVDASKNTQVRQLSMLRDQVAISIRSSAGNLAGLQITAQQLENIALKNCICGEGTCNSASFYPLTLYDNTLGQPQAIPLNLNSTGQSCDPSLPNCLLQISVQLIAQCMPTPLPSSNPIPPAECGGKPAEFIGVLFTIKQRQGAQSPGPTLRTVNGTVFTPVSLLAGVCP